jgi:hypothetical protein
MIKLPIVLASVIAAVPCYAQDVRVFSGSQEHVYGPGGQLVDSPELRAKNERARQMLSEKRLIGPAEQQSLSIQQSNPSQVPNSWWSNDAARLQPPTSWWNNNGYEPPRVLGASEYSECSYQSARKPDGSALPLAALRRDTSVVGSNKL